MLKWSEPSPLGCYASTPFGDFYITWRSSKKSYDLEHFPWPIDLLQLISGKTLDECKAEYERRMVEAKYLNGAVA